MVLLLFASCISRCKMVYLNPNNYHVQKTEKLLWVFHMLFLVSCAVRGISLFLKRQWIIELSYRKTNWHALLLCLYDTNVLPVCWSTLQHTICIAVTRQFTLLCNIIVPHTNFNKWHAISQGVMGNKVDELLSKSKDIFHSSYQPASGPIMAHRRLTTRHFWPKFIERTYCFGVDSTRVN